MSTRATATAAGPRRCVLSSFAEPGYLYREQPKDTWDSGWRVFVGDETQADADDAENFQLNRLDTLTAEHPRLVELFRDGVSGSFEWDQMTGHYVRLPDEQSVAWARVPE